MITAQQQKQFEAILKAEQARLRKLGGATDWRIPLYKKASWEPRVLKRAFNAGKQNVTLPAGTVVAAQKTKHPELNSERWTILHQDLLCQTSLGPKFAQYI